MSPDDTRERLFELSDMLQKSVESALVLQQHAATLGARSQQASDALKQASRDLPPAISASVKQQLEMAVDTAAKRMVERWTQADTAASRATETYRSAETSLSWKLLMVGCTAFIVLTSLMVAAAIYFTPSVVVIQNLMTERDQLQASIAALKRAGALTQLSTCDDNGKPKVCVRIDPNSPNFQGGYKLIASR